MVEMLFALDGGASLCLSESPFNLRLNSDTKVPDQSFVVVMLFKELKTSLSGTTAKRTNMRMMISRLSLGTG